MRGLTRGLSALVTVTLVVALAAGCAPGGETAGSGQPGGGRSEGGEQQQVRPVALTIAPADEAIAVSPIDPVTVTATDGTITEVALTNPEGRPVQGTLAPDGLTWASAEPLGYGRSYTITATARGAAGEQVTATSTFTTVKPKTVTYPSMNPLEGQVVGVGQPVAIYFDESITDKAAAEQAITIETTPHVDGAFYWYSDKEVHWRPQAYWAPGTAVVADIRIYGKDLGGGVYGEEDRRIAFAIGDAVIARADGASHQMSVEVNGAIVRTVPVSLGKPAAPSNNGVHVVTEKHEKKIMDSSTYGVPVDSPDGYRTEVDWAVRISNGGEFVHSAPWSVADQGLRNVSHGCVNVAPDVAKWYFDLVKKGDIVIITNAGGPDLRSWDGFGDWQIPWAEWQAGGHR